MSVVVSDSMRSAYNCIDPYGSTRTVGKTSVMDLKSIYGICHYRDSYIVQGSGSVIHVDSMFEVSVTGGTDSAALVSTEKGTYVAGFASECGLGLQFDPSQFTGNQTLDFGYFDADNGYFFRYSAAQDLSLHVRKAGVTYDIFKVDWNGDFGKHVELDFANGLVYILNFTYYGFGAVLFSVTYADASGSQINRLLHSYSSAAGITCLNPNLPINVNLASNGTPGAVTARVGGRQFSILSDEFEPKFRTTSVQESANGVNSTTWLPVASYLKTSTYKMCAMKVHELDVLSSDPVCIALRIDTQLTGATYTASIDDPDCTPGASGLTRDTAATSVTGGILLFKRIFPAGYSTCSVPTSANIDERNLTIACKALSSTSSGSTCSVDLVIRIKEYF